MSGQKTFKDPDWVASVDQVNTLKPYLPDNAVGVAYTDAQILFTSGKAAMFPGGSFELGFFQKQNPSLKMGVFEVPAPDGSPSTKPTTTGYADGAFGVSARSDAQDASKELVKWMSTKEFGQLVADKIKQLSAVPGVTYTDPLLKQMADSYAKNPTPYLLLVDFRYGTPSGTDVLGAGLQELLLGRKTRPRSATSCRPASRSGSSRRRSPGCHDVPACSSWLRRCCCSGCSCSTRWCLRLQLRVLRLAGHRPRRVRRPGQLHHAVHPGAVPHPAAQGVRAQHRLLRGDDGHPEHPGPGHRGPAAPSGPYPAAAADAVRDALPRQPHRDRLPVDTAAVAHVRAGQRAAAPGGARVAGGAVAG